MSFVDGSEGQKMFYIASLRCENEARTMALWNLLAEKNINVVIMSDMAEVMIN